MAANSADHSERSDLVRGLGLWSATAIVIGDTIGTGVFLVSSDMARAVGRPRWFWPHGSWRCSSCFWVPFAMPNWGRHFRKQGGPYVYLSRGLGPLWGFLFGWMSSFLERPWAWPPWRRGSCDFWDFCFPWWLCLCSPATSGATRSRFTVAQPLAALVVMMATAVNYFSVRIRRSYSGSADFPEDGRDPGHRYRRRAIRNDKCQPSRARRRPSWAWERLAPY